MRALEKEAREHGRASKQMERRGSKAGAVRESKWMETGLDVSIKGQMFLSL